MLVYLSTWLKLKKFYLDKSKVNNKFGTEGVDSYIV
jgi:hypothetical protein